MRLLMCLESPKIFRIEAPGLIRRLPVPGLSYRRFQVEREY